MTDCAEAVRRPRIVQGSSEEQMKETMGGAVTNESRQKVMKVLGEYGCYFLSLVQAAERLTGKRIDAVGAYLDALIKKRTDGEATMLDPAAVLSAMAGGMWTVRKETADYIPRDGEVEVLVFQNGAYTHFVLGDGTGGVLYDPLGNSNTVAHGRIIGKRIFARV